MIAQKYKLTSVYNKNLPYTFGTSLYTQLDNTIYETNLETQETANIITNTLIVNFKLIDNKIIYFNTDLYKYNIETKLTEKTEYNNLIRDVTDKLIFFEDGKILYNNQVIYNLVYTSYTNKYDVLYISDETNLFRICLLTNKVEKMNSYSNILKISFIDDKLLVFTKTHIYHSKGSFELDIEDVVIYNKTFLINNIEYDSDCKIVKKHDKTLYCNMGIKYDDSYTIYMDELCLIGFLDDVLEVKNIDNRLVFCSNNKLIITGYLSVDKVYACFGTQFVNHSDTILSISYYGRYLLTTSRDETAALYDDLKYVRSFKTGVMNSSCIVDDMCVMGGDDGLLVKINLIENNDSSDVAIVKVNDKDINGVFIYRDLIYLACANKVCKILDFDLKTVKVLSDHKKSVMSVQVSSSYICTASSDKTIRVYTHDYKCVSVLSGDVGFLCCRLVDKKLISSSVGGNVKAWDIKKGLSTDSFEVSGEVWDISTEKNGDDVVIRFGTTNNIFEYLVYKDYTTKNNTIHMKNKEFDKVVTSNPKLIYFLIKNDRSLISKYKNKLGDIILQCGRFKDLEFLSEIFESKVFDKEVVNTMKKYFMMSDDLFRDIEASEIHFK